MALNLTWCKKAHFKSKGMRRYMDRGLHMWNVNLRRLQNIPYRDTSRMMAGQFQKYLNTLHTKRLSLIYIDFFFAIFPVSRTLCTRHLQQSTFKRPFSVKICAQNPQVDTQVSTIIFRLYVQTIRRKLKQVKLSGHGWHTF